MNPMPLFMGAVACWILAVWTKDPAYNAGGLVLFIMAMAIMAKKTKGEK